ncbi:MAG: carboxypeptidase regulatory-like domain-containing protein, partial [Polyangiaceae bacterium]
MPVASRARRFVVAASLLVIGVSGAVVVHFQRAKSHGIEQPAIASSTIAPPMLPAPRKPQLEGHVVDANGDVVNGAHVRVLVGTKSVAETATDSTGRFAFDHLANGLIRVEADHEPEGAVDSASITISSETTDLTLVLVAAGIGGVVVDGTDGHAIAGVALSVEGVPFSTTSATTDAAGAFHFAAVPFEATAIVAVASGYRTSRAAFAARENQPEPVLHITLRAAPAVEGDVVDPDGKPIRARVVACENQPFEAHVESGDDGAFQLPPSAVGCDAFALHDDLAASAAMPIVEGRHLTLRLGAPGAIAGFAVDERGRSLDSFMVGVESFVPARGVAVRPNGATPFQSGRFQLDRLVPGTYVLTVVTPGRPPARSDRVVVKSGVTTDGVKIVIPSGGIVEGRVLDDQHVPIADVELRFDAVSAVAASDAVARTDASGHYRLEGAPAGPFTVGAHKEGYRHKLVSGLTAASGTTTTKDITLTKGNGFELSGIGATLSNAGGGITFAGILPDDPAELG